MAYLTDKEKRLLFLALSREKEVCKQVDKDFYREPYETKLETIVENLERKFYHNRFEREIRAKAIDEFAEKLSLEISESIIWGMLSIDCKDSVSDEIFDYVIDTSKQIAEQMKVGGTDGKID